MRLFDADGLFFKILATIANVMEVNFLWIIFSLPIVTIGASTTAAYYVSLKMVKGEEGKIMKQFFDAFKDNFKQSTIIWLIYGVYGYFLLNGISFIRHTDCGIMYTVATIIVTILYLFISIYTYPMIARYTCTSIKATIKNAFLVSLRFFPKTILMILIIGIIVVGVMINPKIVILLFLFGAGGLIYLVSCFMVNIFAKLEEEMDMTQANEN